MTTSANFSYSSIPFKSQNLNMAPQTNSAISTVFVPYLSHILELVCSKLSLLLLINTHGTLNFVDLIHKLIRILISYGPKVDWRTHSAEIPQSISRGASIWVIYRRNFSSILGCDSLCLSSDGLSHQKQCFSHFSIHQHTWVKKQLYSCGCGQRGSLLSSSRCFSNSPACVCSAVHSLHAHTIRNFDARMTQNVKDLHATIKLEEGKIVNITQYLCHDCREIHNHKIVIY